MYTTKDSDSLLESTNKHSEVKGKDPKSSSHFPDCGQNWSSMFPVHITTDYRLGIVFHSPTHDLPTPTYHWSYNIPSLFPFK